MRNLFLGRRAFLKNGSLLLASASLSAVRLESLLADSPPSTGGVQIGLITDLHYADKPHRGTRYYRETLTKLAEAGKQFRKDKPDFVVELGDLIDSADSLERELRNLKRINQDFSAISKDRHYVLGNHCVETLTKAEFLEVAEQKQSYYSFDREGFHFVVLDACFRSDGKPYGRKNSHWTDANIPPAEVEWLQADLQKGDKPTIVFAHQRLDVTNRHGVKNALEIRKVLEQSGRVLAVFQGHSHRNDYHDINGIHYCTLVAMIEGSGAENNGYSLLSLKPGGPLQLQGFRVQKNYRWTRS